MASQAPVVALWRLFDERRFEDARPLLADDFTAEWPQTRERYPGPDAFIQANLAYPGKWRCHLKEIVTAGDRVVTEVEITDGESIVHAISFFTLRGGRIAKAREFFADPGDPPFDRSRWAERY